MHRCTVVQIIKRQGIFFIYVTKNGLHFQLNEMDPGDTGELRLVYDRNHQLWVVGEATWLCVENNVCFLVKHMHRCTVYKWLKEREFVDICNKRWPPFPATWNCSWGHWGTHTSVRPKPPILGLWARQRGCVRKVMFASWSNTCTGAPWSKYLGGRHLVDIKGDFSWTNGVSFRGQFWVTFRGHFWVPEKLGDDSWEGLHDSSLAPTIHCKYVPSWNWGADYAYKIILFAIWNRNLQTRQ